jgi:hypothetical protein
MIQVKEYPPSNQMALSSNSPVDTQKEEQRNKDSLKLNIHNKNEHLLGSYQVSGIMFSALISSNPQSRYKYYPQFRELR